MSNVTEILHSAVEFLRVKVIPWTDEILCNLVDDRRRLNVPTYLLGGVYVTLKEISNALAFGSHYYNINPVTLTSTGGAVLIVDTQNQGRVRKVSIWADAASGGPLPVLRISKTASGTSSGGIRISPGQVSELGEVPASVRLYAVSSQTITVYVIERG